MRRMIGWVLANKSVSVLATVLLVAGGAYGATQLEQETLPEVELPLVTVNTAVPGASAETVDGTVTEPIQDAVGGIEGLDNVQGTSSQGISAVQVEFGYETDLDDAEAEVRNAVAGAELPEQAAEPEISRVAPDQFPVQVVSVAADDGDGGDEELSGYSDDDLRGLTRYVEDEVVPSIEGVEGVGAVSVVGDSETLAGVEMDPERLRENDLSAQSVLDAVNGSEVESPVGSGSVGGDRSTPILAEGEISTIDELRRLPVSSTTSAPSSGASASASTPATAAPTGAPSGTVAGQPGEQPEGGSPEPVALEEVAEVKERQSELSGVARADETPSLALSITRDADANIVEVAEGVDAELERIRADMGDARQVTVISDESETVSESVNDVLFKGLIGVAAAVAVILVFLRRWRATLVAAVSLPTSIAAALLFSWSADLTINIMTLGGLVIAVGRVVDDAIVVLENSDRYLRRGYGPDQAALLGTTEVASAITSSTLCTVAVFLPLAFVGGIVGQVFTQLALTVTFALLASLIVALTIVPVLISLFLKRRANRREAENAPENHDRDGALARRYAPVLAWSVRRRGVVLFVAAAVFVGGLAMATQLPSSFFPAQESSILSAQVELPEGTPLDTTSRELRPFEEFLAKDSDVGGYQLQIGGESSGSVAEGPGGGGVRPENRADLTIALEEGADVSAALNRIEEEGEDLYGARGVRLDVVSSSPASSEVEATITGGTAAERERAAGLVRAEMADSENVKDVESSVSGGAPQVSIAIDEERAAEAGLTSEAAAGAISGLFGGATAQAGGTQQATVDGQPIVVGVPEESLDSVEAVRELPVAPDVTVGDIADAEQSESASSIGRIDGEEAATVSGFITGEDTTGVTNAVTRNIDDLDLPEDVKVSIGGEQDDVTEGFGNMFVAIAVAIALVYLILVAFFGSVLTPLVILLSLPLTTAGAFGALLLTGTPLSVPALLGMLLLVGIVVANAILLVDFAERARRDGASAEEAMISAGKARLRPVLMTALATVAALVPLAAGIGSGAGLINSALAIPVIGGLVTSTLLTLLVVPAGYSLARGGKKRTGAGPGGPDRGPSGDSEGGPGGSLEAETGSPEDREPDREPEREPVGAGASGGAVQFEMGRAQGRIETLESELRRRESELARLRDGSVRRTTSGVSRGKLLPFFRRVSK